MRALSADPTIGGILQGLKGVDGTAAAAKKGGMLHHISVHERAAAMEATPPPAWRRRRTHAHAPAGDPDVTQDSEYPVLMSPGTSGNTGSSESTRFSYNLVVQHSSLPHT